jgi:ribosomal protein S18 acetylase RimI-like enzyme
LRAKEENQAREGGREVTSGEVYSEVRIKPIGPDNLNDRLHVCWSHLENWESSEIVAENRAWIEKINEMFSPSSFIAYRGSAPIGIIEFMPRDMLHHEDFCPCRRRKGGEGAVLPSLGTDYRDYLFITCLWVPGSSQKKGVGNALLMHLLDSDVFKHFRGALVFVGDRNPAWPDTVHWPAGPRKFYERAGFEVVKRLEETPGHLLKYDRQPDA